MAGGRADRRRLGGGWRSGSLRGRRLRISGWGRTLGGASSPLLFGVVARDIDGGRLVTGRVQVLPDGRDWTFFDVSVDLPRISRVVTGGPS